jgi:hypothetical protein
MSNWKDLYPTDDTPDVALTSGAEFLQGRISRETVVRRRYVIANRCQVVEAEHYADIRSMVCSAAHLALRVAIQDECFENEEEYSIDVDDDEIEFEYFDVAYVTSCIAAGGWLLTSAEATVERRRAFWNEYLGVYFPAILS